MRKRDLIAVAEGVADRAPVRASRVLAHTKRLLRWAAGRDLIELDPAAHILKRTVERKRDRVLSDQELAAVWRAAEVAGDPYGVGVRLLILTDARRHEVFDLRWAEVDRVSAGIRLPASPGETAEGQAHEQVADGGGVQDAHVVESRERCCGAHSSPSYWSCAASSSRAARRLASVAAS